MGVYIRGMEMPKSCWECPMVSGYEIANEAKTVFSTVRCRLTNTKRPAGEAIAPNCPLVPVPPHGRCIDADALYSHIKDEQRKCNDPYDGWSECQVALGFVNTAPTIIPAEEGE